MKLKNRGILAVSICLTVFGVAGGFEAKQPSSIAAPKAEPSLTARASTQVINDKLIAANTRLSFKLFSAILKQQSDCPFGAARSDRNIVISPISVAIALSMTYNGAKGETQQAIARTLEILGMSLEEVNQANAAMRAALTTLDPQVQLSLATSLWVKKGESLLSAFLQNNQKFYGAEVTELDFNDPSTPSIINQWITQSTNGKINQIIERKDIKPNTFLFLLDAIYFKGRWTTAFDKTQTKELPFTLLNGTQKLHPIMFQQSQYWYYANQLFQAVALPYGEGRLRLYLFVPHKHLSLKTFYKNLNAENWEQWMNEFHTEQLIIGLPRFRLDSGLELNDVLKSLGMAIAFDENRADFTGMTPNPAYISQVKHNTFFEVNEEGTEAAAATSVQMGTRASPTQLIVDRPFFFAIRDERTKTILFMGSVIEP